MAQLAIGLVLQVGSAYLMGLLNPNVKGKLDDIQVSTSTYGVAIPRGWGTARYNGNLIYCSPIKETHHTGKGATNKTTQYKYWATFAYAFCAGPAEELLRVWADGKLVYDATATGTLVKDLAFAFKFYAGTEDQLPNEAIEADKGVGQVPAFRGLVYLIGTADLNMFGGRMPNISAEIAMKGSSNFSTTNYTPLVTDLGANGQTGVSFDWNRKTAYRSATGAALASMLSAVSLSTMAETSQKSFDASLGVDSGGHSVYWLASGEGQNIYIQTGVSNSDKVFLIDKDTLSVQGSYGVDNAALVNTAGVNAVYSSGMTVISVPDTGGTFSDYLFLVSNFAGFLLLDGTTLQYVWGAQYAPGTTPMSDYFAPTYTGASARNAIVQGAQNVGSAEAWLISGSASGGTVHVSLATINAGAIYISGAASLGVTVHDVETLSWTGTFLPGEGSSSAGITFVRADYDAANDCLILVLQAGGTSIQRIVSISPGGGGTNWNYKTTGGMAGPLSGQSRLNGTDLAWIGTADGEGANYFIINTHTGTLTKKGAVSGVSAFNNQIFDAQTGAIYLWDGTVFQRVFIALATGEPQPLSEIVTDICAQSGMDPDWFDASELTDNVPGFTAQQETGRKSLEQLSACYIFDAVEHDDVLTFRKRGRSVAATISYNDVKRASDSKSGTEFKPTIQPELETPRRVTVRWPDPARDYQTNSTHVGRRSAPGVVATVASVADQNVDVRVTLAQADAKNLAKRGLLIAWHERETYQDIVVGPEFLALEPTDVVTFATRSGDTVRVRLTKVEVGADWTVKLAGRAEDERLLSLAASAVDGGDVTAPAPFAPDYAVRGLIGYGFPLLEDVNDAGGAGLVSYTAAGTFDGDVSSWKGASLYVSPDNSTWNALSTDSNAMAYGFTSSALPAPASPWLRDDANTLTVAMTENGTHLESATYDQVMNGANAAALIDPATGNTEILQFMTVTPVSGNVYALTGLYRGRRGTDWACGLHTASDMFVLLEAAALVKVVRPLSDLGSPRYVRALSPFDPVDAATSQSVTWRGAAEKPYSPVHIAGTRDGSNNLTITWTRRSRIGGEWVDGFEDTPLGEASEAYVVDVLNGSGAVVRTIAGLTSPTASYAASDQVADGLVPGDPVHVRAFQVSATVGRGYPGDATI